MFVLLFRYETNRITISKVHFQFNLSVFWDSIIFFFFNKKKITNLSGTEKEFSFRYLVGQS
jgi:hypothetical protein